MTEPFGYLFLSYFLNDQITALLLLVPCLFFSATLSVPPPSCLKPDVCLGGLPLDFGTVLKGGRAVQKEAVRLFEIVELNPLYDRDNQTARLAATIITAHLTG